MAQSEPGDVSMDEDESSRESSRESSQQPAPLREVGQQPQGVTGNTTTESEAGSKEPSSTPETYLVKPAVRASHEQPYEEALGPGDDTENTNIIGSVNSDTQPSRSTSNDDDFRQQSEDDVHVPNADDTAPMEIESPASSSEDTDGSADHVMTDDEAHEDRQSSAPLPDQISSATQPGEDVEVIGGETVGEVHVVSSLNPVVLV